jgi:hypothetical protein
MPLKKGKSKETISKNIKSEMGKYKKTGKIGTSKPKTKKKAQKQATAIALSKARESGAKIPKKKKAKKTVVKESFDRYIDLLVKESFGLLKKKVVEEKKEDKIENNKKEESLDLNSENPMLSKKERIKITNHIHNSKILGGNTKVDSISKGLHELGNVLDSCGFNLEMVTGDMINAPKGNILIPFRRKAENPFIEGTEIQNSQISFTWENLEKLEDGFEFKKKYEIIAYLT